MIPIASSTLFVMLSTVSSCDMVIKRSTAVCNPDSTNTPLAFLQRRLATRMALKPDESQYLQLLKSRMMFFSPFQAISTNSDFSDGAM